jgi:DNA-binding IclR family transcriptional regulator
MALARANMVVICQQIVEDLARLREETVQLESFHSYSCRQEQGYAVRHQRSLLRTIRSLLEETAELLHELTHGQRMYD